jgi:hypothetical protein
MEKYGDWRTDLGGTINDIKTYRLNFESKLMSLLPRARQMELLRTIGALHHRTLNLAAQEAPLKSQITGQDISADIKPTEAYRHPLVLRDGAHAFHKPELRGFRECKLRRKHRAE